MSAAESLLYAASAGFEAACEINCLPPGHRARALHGHSYLAEVRCALPAAWADFPGNEVAQLRACLECAVLPLDYQYLNHHLPLPTDENLARWLRNQLNLLALPGIESIAMQSTANSASTANSNSNSTEPASSPTSAFIVASRSTCGTTSFARPIRRW